MQIDFHRGINFAYGVKTALLFAVRTQYTIRSIHSIHIDKTIQIGSHNSFIQQGPGKATTGIGRIPKQFPEVAESGTTTTVILRMQKFGWNKDGTPNYGEPISTGVPLPLPSGTPDKPR